MLTFKKTYTFTRNMKNKAKNIYNQILKAKAKIIIIFFILYFNEFGGIAREKINFRKEKNHRFL